VLQVCGIGSVHNIECPHSHYARSAHRGTNMPGQSGIFHRQAFVVWRKTTHICVCSIATTRPRQPLHHQHTHTSRRAVGHHYIITPSRLHLFTPIATSGNARRRTMKYHRVLTANTSAHVFIIYQRIPPFLRINCVTTIDANSTPNTGAGRAMITPISYRRIKCRHAV